VVAGDHHDANASLGGGLGDRGGALAALRVTTPTSVLMVEAPAPGECND
jgi:hypothetical protein